jgi:hypothetical protein
MWLDAAKCKVGLEALGRYRRGYDRTLGEYTERPVHDQRYLDHHRRGRVTHVDSPSPRCA